MTYLGIQRVISGGQTGADQGGLLAAWERGIPTGGWAPYDYRTTLGPNPLLEVLGLVMTDEKGYTPRTTRNVEEADATLVCGYDLTSPGSRRTIDHAQAVGRPCFVLEFPAGRDGGSKEVRLIEQAVTFILRHQPTILNVAGNRDSDATNINFTTTRRVVGLILDLTKERLAEQAQDTIHPTDPPQQDAP